VLCIGAIPTFHQTYSIDHTLYANALPLFPLWLFLFSPTPFNPSNSAYTILS
jgi:hypothetical protein